MQDRALISARAFCTHHHIELSFLHSLHDFGLIQITTSEDEDLLEQEQLEALERMVRLHYDLHINLEGIDAIHHLLQRVEEMQQELSLIRNRLRLYESPDPEL